MILLVLILIKHTFNLAQYNTRPALLIIGSTFVIAFLFIIIYFFTKCDRESLDESDQDELGITSFNRLCILLVFSLSISLPFTFFYKIQSNDNLTELDENPVTSSGPRKDIALDNTDLLCNFLPENYISLDYNERLEALQFIEFIEAKVAGRPANKVISTPLNQDILGKYHPLLNIIIINDYLLTSDEPELTLRILLHESQHANQYELMKSLNLQNRTTYTLIALQDYVAITNNLNSYIDYSEELDNYDEYYNQLVEVDANFNALVALSQYSQVVYGISPYLDELNRNHE
jgi:hypothetical protein